MKIPSKSIRPTTKGKGSENVETGTYASDTVDRPRLEELIATAAYFHAEKRGFAPGNELTDWFQAEAEVKKNHPGIAPT